MISTLFTVLGFSKNEIKVFLSLAEIGKSPASLIAKRVSIPRTTAYSVLDKLVERGVVSIEHKGSSTFYTANPPESLLRIVEQQKAEVEEKENAVKDLVELVTPFFKGTNYSIPKLQFFEGDKNVRNLMYESYPTWRKSMEQYDYTWWGYQDHTWVELYFDILAAEWENADKRETVKLFTNKTPVEKKLEGRWERRHIKVVPDQFKFTSTIWVLGDYIVLLMLRQKPHYAYQIMDPVFSKNLRSVFQMLWAATD